MTQFFWTTSKPKVVVDLQKIAIKFPAPRPHAGTLHTASWRKIMAMLLMNYIWTRLNVLRALLENRKVILWILLEFNTASFHLY
jgi:hypothetical protein